jgi:hypothetical protein
MSPSTPTKSPVRPPRAATGSSTGGLNGAPGKPVALPRSPARDEAGSGSSPHSPQQVTIRPRPLRTTSGSRGLKGSSRSVAGRVYYWVFC